MREARPGLNPPRLIRLIEAAIERCRLDLSGLTVLTEAASGAYVVTPLLAAMAGAEVYALASGTAYSSADGIQELTLELAGFGRVRDRIQLIPCKDRSVAGQADIVTNSGQVRPIDAEMVAGMKASAVVPLMYESWEFRPTDVDLDACRTRGIRVAGTNEQHPAVDVFSYLGQMALMQLHDAGIAVRESRIVLLCDNDFAPYIVRDLKNAGADVTEMCQWSTADMSPLVDAVIVAMKPRGAPVFNAADALRLSQKAPGAVLVQYWGDVDRTALAAAEVPVWPPRAPPAGHMGILPSAVGPEPIVRLQAGGLKVGQILQHGLERASPEDLELVQLL